jgi:hypothetical protein
MQTDVGAAIHVLIVECVIVVGPAIAAYEMRAFLRANIGEFASVQALATVFALHGIHLPSPSFVAGFID